MRAVMIIAAAAVLPAPALAQDAAQPGQAMPQDGSSRAVAREMSDPVRQAEMAAAMEGMAGALLDMPAAPFLRAAAKMAGQGPVPIDPDARIGDLAGPEAAQAPREMAQRLPQMMGAMADVAVAFEDMLPRMAEAMARARERALPNPR